MLVIVLVAAAQVAFVHCQRIYMTFGSNQQVLYDYGRRVNFVYDEDLFDCRTQLFPYEQTQ